MPAWVGTADAWPTPLPAGPLLQGSSGRDSRADHTGVDLANRPRKTLARDGLEYHRLWQCTSTPTPGPSGAARTLGQRDRSAAPAGALSAHVECRAEIPARHDHDRRFSLPGPPHTWRLA